MLERWRKEDDAQLAELGIRIEEVQRQIRLFEHPPEPIALIRPCTVGDGIRVLSESEVAAAMASHDDACARGRVIKFVPASGAASRMFQALLAIKPAADGDYRTAAAARAAGGDQVAAELLKFADGLERFAFYDELVQVMAGHGLDAAALALRGQFAEILDHLLMAKGLDYNALPKGLLLFHRYPTGSRTAVEEHLVEAAAYVRDGHGVCRLHLTVSPQHEARFKARLDTVRTTYEALFSVRFDVGFSHQKSSTDTVAVDVDDRPVRTKDGRLLFRPGGHGALIENLNDLQADIVSIKNIDNIVPDHLRPTSVTWKRILIGYLAGIQQQIFRLVSDLHAQAALQPALEFARTQLCLRPPPGLSAEQQRAFLLRTLDRPLRVCGIVRNTGEPGGGPFWVRAADGTESLQIVESAQVDSRSAAQQAIFKTSTHFNPVDLACAVRDASGRPYDLHRYVDPNAVFIAEKSKDGQPLKALELPGLWNGAMAEWTTVFVEVPASTFNPVKTVNDLLRPEHQPISG